MNKQDPRAFRPWKPDTIAGIGMWGDFNRMVRKNPNPIRVMFIEYAFAQSILVANAAIERMMKS